MAQRIGEIEQLEERAAASEQRILELEAFNKYLKSKLRAAREQGI